MVLSPSRACGAATLLEMLVVCVIGVILLALFFPALKKFNETAQRNKCVANLRAIGNGLLSVAADNNGRFPALGNNSVEQRPTWAMRTAEQLGINLNQRAQRTVFWCPGDRTHESETGQFMHQHHVGHASYAVNVNLMDWEQGTSALGGAARGGLRLAQILRPSKTLMVVENHKANNVISWADQGGKTWQKGWTFEYTMAGKAEDEDAGKQGYHQGVNNWLFADGHVETMNFRDTLEPINLWRPE